MLKGGRMPPEETLSYDFNHMFPIAPISNDCDDKLLFISKMKRFLTPRFIFQNVKMYVPYNYPKYFVQITFL